MNMKGKDVARTPRYAVPTRLMTVRDLSIYLHVHKSTIYRMLRQREIPAFRIGNDWRFNIESIDRWCSEQSEHKQPRNGSVLCEERAAADCNIDVDAQAKALRLRMYKGAGCASSSPTSTRSCASSAQPNANGGADPRRPDFSRQIL